MVQEFLNLFKNAIFVLHSSRLSPPTLQGKSSFSICFMSWKLHINKNLHKCRKMGVKIFSIKQWIYTSIYLCVLRPCRQRGLMIKCVYVSVAKVVGSKTLYYPVYWFSRAFNKGPWWLYNCSWLSSCQCSQTYKGGGGHWKKISKSTYSLESFIGKLSQRL